MSLRDRLRKYSRDLVTLPHDVRLVYRRGGWLEVRQLLADRTWHRIYRAERMLVIEQDLEHFRDVPIPAGVSIRKLEDRDWAALGALVPMRELDRFRKVVSGGHVCLIAWRGTQPIGYTWYAGHLAPEVSILPIPLPSDAAYLWDLYVIPSERSTGIGSALVAARLRLAREAGFKLGWRAVLPTNAPSLRTVDKTAGNGRVLGEVRYVKVLSRMFASYAPTAEPGRVPR